jgi:hypothetical protein
MQPAMYHSGASTLWANALFVSVLQRSDKPSAIRAKALARDGRWSPSPPRSR